MAILATDKSEASPILLPSEADTEWTRLMLLPLTRAEKS